MKKLALYVLLVVSLFACEEERHFFEGEAYTVLERTSISISEISTGASFALLRSNASEAATVELTVTSYYAGDETRSAASGFTISTTSVSFAKDEYSATVSIIPVNDVLSDGNKIVKVSLSSTSQANVRLGYPGVAANNTSLTATIVDDDCPLNSDAFVGTFSVAEVFTAGPNQGGSLAGFFGESYEVQLAKEAGDISGTRFVITNSTGKDVYFNNGTVIAFNTCARAVGFPDGNPQLALFAVLGITSTSYNESTSTITIAGPLATYGAYQVVLTRK